MVHSLSRSDATEVPRRVEDEFRILVLAPLSNDGRLTVDFLSKAGLSAVLCADIGELCERALSGCGGLLLAEEALAHGGALHLASTLQSQPSWSDMPMVVITGNGDVAARSHMLTTLGSAGNISIIERPVRPATLVSTFLFALASRRRQYQVRTLLAERENMVSILSQADRRKDEFLAMLAHELRNPLASIANAAGLLKTSPDSECHTWAANVIERQIHQLSHLIDDLLDVSRITTGKIRLRQECLDAALILDRTCECVRPLVRQRNHDLICQYPHGSLWLEADPTRLEQILLNLLTNAAKYTPTGGRITLSAKREGSDIVIRVTDNGMGIAPERMPEMFELFAQGERSIARSEGGLGIGLTIVQKLVELHGGKVEAHSEGHNLGSVFTVRLPGVPKPVRATDEGHASNSKELGFTAKSIVIVDDNIDSAQGLARLLSRIGHQICVAHDGPQALNLVRENRPQAIIMDIGLPGMDGYEVARRIRQENGHANTLLIAVTGYGQEEDRQEALNAGFDHHLIKPVNVAELRRLLAN